MIRRSIVFCSLAAISLVNALLFVQNRVGSVPEWAPSGENHLLRPSSVVVKVGYGPRELRYRTFDRVMRESSCIWHSIRRMFTHLPGTTRRRREAFQFLDWPYFP